LTQNRTCAIYLDDIPLIEGTLYAWLRVRPLLTEELKKLDTAEAEISRRGQIITAKV